MHRNTYFASCDPGTPPVKLIEWVNNRAKGLRTGIVAGNQQSRSVSEPGPSDKTKQIADNQNSRSVAAPSNATTQNVDDLQNRSLDGLSEKSVQNGDNQPNCSLDGPPDKTKQIGGRSDEANQNVDNQQEDSIDKSSDKSKHGTDNQHNRSNAGASSTTKTIADNRQGQSVNGPSHTTQQTSPNVLKIFGDAYNSVASGTVSARLFEDYKAAHKKFEEALENGNMQRASVYFDYARMLVENIPTYHSIGLESICCHLSHKSWCEGASLYDAVYDTNAAIPEPKGDGRCLKCSILPQL